MKKLINVLMVLLVYIMFQAQIYGQDKTQKEVSLEPKLIVLSIYNMTISNWNPSTERWDEESSDNLDIRAYLNTEIHVITFNNMGKVKLYLIEEVKIINVPDSDGEVTEIHEWSGIDDSAYKISIWIREWKGYNRYELYVWYNKFAIRYDAFQYNI